MPLEADQQWLESGCCIITPMRRLWILCLLLLVSCRAFTPRTWFPQTLVPTQIPALVTPSALDYSSTTPPPPAVTLSPFLPATPSLTPPVQTPTFPFTPPATQPPSATTTQSTPVSGIHVRYHPDGPLSVGDQISLEVIKLDGSHTTGQSVQVQLEAPSGPILGSGNFSSFGLGERQQVTLMWVWDTRLSTAGQHRLTFTIQPANLSWVDTITLQPRQAVPPPEPNAAWAIAKSSCCTINYITGTEAERDLPDMLKMTAEQAQDASQRLGINFTVPITITLLPRVLGHGGFTSREIAVSKVDRNYAAGWPAMVLHHEMIHELDNRLGGKNRPSILVEGLAVYLTGGHFKPEPLMQRAAALLDPTPGCVHTTPGNHNSSQSQPICGLGWYIPLVNLTDNFYPSQHEIGYLEGAALIEFIVKTWGWQAFADLYRNMPDPAQLPDQPTNPTPSQVLDTALQTHLGLSLTDLEQRFVEALRNGELESRWVSDVQLTVNFYNTMRRYQQLLDPSAYYLTAWLPEPAEMRQRSIVADYLRRPSTPANLALELMLATAGTSLNSGDYATAQDILNSIKTVLDHVEAQDPQPFSSDTLAADYASIVQAVVNVGYQPQRLRITNFSAQVWVRAVSPELLLLNLFQTGRGWRFVGETRWTFPWQQQPWGFAWLLYRH